VKRENDIQQLTDMQPLYQRLQDKLAHIKKARPLPAVALNRLRENLSLEWTYNSNSIEGNTLSLRETQLVIQEGITIRGKSLREHFEAINHEKAIEHLYALVKPSYRLRAIDILSLHGYVMRNIDDDFAGRLRNAAVRITGANFTPPSATKVPDLLDELVLYINENPDDLNDIELATFFHHRLVWIHPFFDGNGRTARLAMNLLLLRSGYPPAIILKNDRKKYYEALNQANKGHYAKLSLLMVQALERSLNIYLAAMPGAGNDYELIQTIAEEEAMPYGQEYLSLLARRGKIDAYKEGRNWLTTRKAVKDYMAGRKRERRV
jgi:Fic family protein